MNNVSLIGRITKDLDVRLTDSGKKVVTFNLAIDRIGAKEGQQDADFPQVVAWDKTAEILERYAHKGSQIGVVGRIQTRTYDNKHGEKVYITEVVAKEIKLLDPKPKQEQPSANEYGQPPF